MAERVLEAGETVMFRERVGNVRDAYAVCELIATDRRLVLASIDMKRSAVNGLMWLGAIGGVIGGLIGSRRKRATHQIRRHEFGAVDVTGDRDLLIQSTGEGYAKQHFEISTKEPQALAARIHRWAAGLADDSAGLPVAVVRKPD